LVLFLPRLSNSDISDSCYSLREIGDYWRECPLSEVKEMITKILIAAALVLSCSLCLAEDFPKNTYEIKSLTAEQAAELVAVKKGSLFLPGLTSIDKDVTQELAKIKGELYLGGLTSIDKDVAQELGKFEGLWLHLRGLTSIDKDVAHELAKVKGRGLYLSGLTSIDKDVAHELAKVKRNLFLNGLTSIDKDVLKILKSNPKIQLPEKYSD